MDAACLQLVSLPPRETDVIRILTSGDHLPIGRGIADISREELTGALQSHDAQRKIVVHKDNLVLALTH